MSRHPQIFQLLTQIFEKLSSSSPKRIKEFECALLSHIQVPNMYCNLIFKDSFERFFFFSRFDFQVPD